MKTYLLVIMYISPLTGIKSTFHEEVMDYNLEDAFRTACARHFVGMKYCRVLSATAI